MGTSCQPFAYIKEATGCADKDMEVRIWRDYGNFIAYAFECLADGHPVVADIMAVTHTIVGSPNADSLGAAMSAMFSVITIHAFQSHTFQIHQRAGGYLDRPDLQFAVPGPGDLDLPQLERYERRPRGG